MAVAHLTFNQSSTHAHLIRNAMGSLENGLSGLLQCTGTMALMIDGDGSQDAHYLAMADRFGFADGATARAAFNELLSLKGKLTVDSAVTNVNAAMIQAFNKLR